MENWIPFGQGTYAVERAYVVSPDLKALSLAQTILDVHEGQGGRRSLVGRGKAQNALLVELLEDHDQLDIALDLGPPFTFLLKAPDIQAGKVFAPGVAAMLQFVPQAPWQVLSAEAFQALMDRLRFIDR